MNGSVTEKEKMLESLLPFIKNKAKIGGEINDDLLQELLMVTFGKALKKFDLDKNVKFITFLNYILDHTKIKFLKKFHNDFDSVNIENFDSVVSKKYSFNNVSIDNDDNNIDNIASNLLHTEKLEEKIIEKDIRTKVLKLLEKTTYGRDKDILKQYLLQNKTYKEIAEQYNLSTTRISQIYYKALDNFRETCRLRGIM